MIDRAKEQELYDKIDVLIHESNMKVTMVLQGQIDEEGQVDTYFHMCSDISTEALITLMDQIYEKLTERNAIPKQDRRSSLN